MFGMIYGALICEKAGVSMEDYVAQIPLTIKIVQDYYDLFAATVPSGNFDDPPASLGTYHAALQDVVNSCRDLGTADELPRLLRDLRLPRDPDPQPAPSRACPHTSPPVAPPVGGFENQNDLDLCYRLRWACA